MILAIYLSAYIFPVMGAVDYHLPPTVGPQERTAATAAAVVQCSSTIRSFGNRSFSIAKVGKNNSSALRSVTSDPTLLGTSPCRLSTRSCFSIAANTGKNSVYVVTPDAEFVVTPMQWLTSTFPGERRDKRLVSSGIHLGGTL